MEFYEAIQTRRTVRDFSDKAVPQETVERILQAGLQAPTHNHLREWEFVLLQNQQDKETALQFVERWADVQEENKSSLPSGTPAQRMYAYAMPRQYDMLTTAPYVVLPFFKAGAGLLRASTFSALNPFASIWCVIENIFLGAAAEGMACSMRIPVGDEGEKVARAVHAPQEYKMPCYIGIGYPADSAPALEQYEYSAKQKTHYGTW